MTALSATIQRVEIQKINDLPPLPIVANELMATLNDHDADIDDIAQIIVRDPGLTAKILSLANSAFFGFGRNVNTISEAIINVLGLDLVKGLAIGLVMSGTFDTKKCKHFNIGEYWITSLLTAELVKQLNIVKTVDADVNPGFYYLYGLLHNLGMLVLADRFPDEFDQVLISKEANPDEKLVNIENMQLGIDHHSAAMYLADKWQLPKDIYTVMGHYYLTDYRGDYWQISQLTGYSARLVQSWLYEEEDETIDIETLFGYENSKVETITESVRNKLDDVKALAEQMNG